MPRLNSLVRAMAPLAGAALLAAALAPRDAAAQGRASEGCFLNPTTPVPCDYGSGGSGGGSAMSNPAMGAAGSLGFAVGATLGKMLRDALTPPSNNQSDEAAAAQGAALQASLERAMAAKAAAQRQRQAERQQQERQFEQGEQNLLGEMHALDGGNLDAVDATGASGDSELQPRQLDMTGATSVSPAALDSSVVDLSGARTATVDPRTLQIPASAPPPQARDPLPWEVRLFNEMPYLFPEEPGLWPGPQSGSGRLINPLREPQRYQALLTVEEAQFPAQRDRIEKIKAELAADADRRARLARLGDTIAQRYNATVAAADDRAGRQLRKAIDTARAQAGAKDNQALFDKSRQDPALLHALQKTARPILATRAKTVAAAQDRAMGDVLSAIDSLDQSPPEP